MSVLRIEAVDITKKFMRRHVFRNFSFQFHSGTAYAVTGSNGSGKSTLLQILCGYMLPGSGQVDFYWNDVKADAEDQFRYCSIASPFMELIEEFTVSELLNFQAAVKPFVMKDHAEIIRYFQLEKEKDKQVRYLSSGNKQRLKLAQAFCSDTPALILDEPTQNLDEAGVNLYLDAVDRFTAGKLVIVSSNDPREYRFCDPVINIEDYK